MIDDSDGDFAFLAGLSSSGGIAFVLIVFAIILYVAASVNVEECAQRRCANGWTARLLDHECLCVEKAK